MDMKFFTEAMQAAGLAVTVVDEHTVFPMPYDKDKLISSNLVKRSQRPRLCAWCGAAIPTGFAYQRITLKDSKTRSDAVCLECWTTR